MIRTYYSLVLLFCFWGTVRAQEFHFSQTDNTIQLYNPAFNGSGKYSCQLISATRSQWKSIVPNNYNTIFCSLDGSFLKHKLGYGINIIRDIAGDSHMKTIRIGGAISTMIKLNETIDLRFGLEGAYSGQTIDYSSLYWDSQYTTSGFNTALSSYENSQNGQTSLGLLTTGLMLNYIGPKNIKLQAGISIMHLNAPQYNYSSVSNISLFPSRMTYYTKALIKVNNTNTTYVPSLFFSHMQNAYEFIGGVTMYYQLGLNSKYTGINKSSAISFGTFIRSTNDIILKAGYDLKEYVKSYFSYDININTTSTLSSSHGGFELSLILILPEKTIFNEKTVE